MYRRHHEQRPSRQPTWASLKDDGLSERHVLMAIDLGFTPPGLVDAFSSSSQASGLLLLEWVEDAFFAKFGSYVPLDDSANPETQAEHQAESSLLPDPTKLMEQWQSDLDEDEDIDPHTYAERLRESERETPVSYGEIHEEDQNMLRRHENFRKAARVLTRRLAEMPDVQKVLLFGSVALPLWKEVPRFARLRSRQMKVFHECNNIDLAVWVTSSEIAPDIRRAHAATVKELVDNDIHFSIAHHHFSTHLIDQSTGAYLGMVCHYNQCPKHKPACQVPGCGASKFVQVLPWFKLKPQRLNTHNSQVLFER